MLEASTSTKQYGRQLLENWSVGERRRHRVDHYTVAVYSQRQNSGRACTAEDFTDVQLKTVGPPGLAALSCWSEVP